ncbi:hypothetical protein LCGC14_2769830 [marine sediment metagenome]|uniref:Uncharacterized protein n=1 Tax=marine sediment metagenome TaxID=412755 RepID=A0A0F8ZIB0_9ZZZZ
METEAKMQLTIKDIEHLMDAVTEWERAPGRDAMSKSSMKMMLGAIAKVDRDKMEQELNSDMEESKMQESLREETAVLLKAKLIQMRNEIEHERV